MTQPKKPPLLVETIAQSAVLQTLKVEVGAPRVRKAFDRAYRELAQQVRVKGFRPGKTPRSVLERLYGASVAEQLEHTLVAETLSEAVELAGLEPVSEPAIEAGKPVPGASFQYTASVEVRPVLELPDLKGLPAIRPSVDVDESAVDESLEKLRHAHAPLREEPEGATVAAEHTATIDFVGRIDGEVFEGGSGQGVALEIGADQFIPGFEDQLIGAKTGEDREVGVRFPDNYGNSELAGKHAIFEVHVVDIRRRQLPELDDEFAKDVGDFDSLEALRERIRSDLESARERESKETFRTTMVDALLARTEFEVPPGMVDRQLRSQLAAAGRRLEGQVDPEALRAQIDRWSEEWRPRAERDVREMLVLEAVARAQQIKVEDPEVEARIDAMAGDGAPSPAKLRELRGDEQFSAAVRLQLRDEKVLDFLSSQAKIGEDTST